MPTSERRPARRAGTALLLLAGALTLLNAVKPLHIDDPFSYRVAQQIAAHPFDPYGFEIFWAQWPQPVFEELTPPVLPYWLALGLRLLGERPVLLKLWLLPFAVLLVVALWRLLRRFAPGVELPVVTLTVLSPAVLPGFNLMQDIPALALGLSGLALYLDAAERNSLRRAAAAGLVAGLATQTKYTTVSLLAAMALHGLLHRRLRAAALAVATAVAVFAGWEALMQLRYGTGMLVGQLTTELFWVPRVQMVLPLLRILGAVAPTLALLGLAAAGLRRSVVTGATVAVLAGHALLCWQPWQTGWFTLLGATVAVFLAGAAVERLGVGTVAVSATPGRRAGAFLVGWLLIEVALYFVVSPFPAVRRVLGVVVAGTLLMALQVADARRRRPGSARLAALTAATVALGGLFWWVDLNEAEAQRRAPAVAEAVVGAIDPQPSVWFVGHWGFQYYAERAGMRAVVPDHSRLAAGDWLVVPQGIDRQEIRLSTDDAVPYAVLRDERGPPLRTGIGYYGGSLPLAHRDGPFLETRVYRITRELVPPSGWTTARIADWVLRSGGRTAAAALPALQAALRHPRADDRQLAALGLANLGSRAAPAVPALIEALDDPQAPVRYWAALALGAVGEAARAALPALREASKDIDPEVRAAAGRALEQLGD